MHLEGLRTILHSYCFSVFLSIELDMERNTENAKTRWNRSETPANAIKLKLKSKHATRKVKSILLFFPLF